MTWIGDAGHITYERVQASNRPPLWYVKHWDLDNPGRDGRPEVQRMLPAVSTPFNKDWQEFYFELTRTYWGAFDDGFQRKRWTSLNGNHLALMNNTGFSDEPGEYRANYITGENESYPLPAYDKTRSMGGNVLTGFEQDGLLYVETLNGNDPPPDVAWVLERPWYYFHCVLAWPERVGLFPQGCDNKNGIWQVTIAPLVSRTTVAIELDRVERLADNAEIPDVYYLPKPTLWQRIRRFLALPK